MTRYHFTLAVISILAVACATSGTSGSSNSPSAANSSRLTTTEITAAKLPTAYDLVDRLRHRWLLPDQTTGGAATVYIDDQKLGGVDALRDIPAADVAEMQYMPSDKAIMRWGQDAGGGAIVVTRKR